MIGQLTWTPTKGLPPIVVTMGDDLSFSVKGRSPSVATDIVAMLDSDHDDSEQGPAQGWPGVAFLERKAKELGAELKIARRADRGDKDAVY